MSAALVLVLAMVLAAEFVNGWTDAPNAIATVVATRVLTPLRAVLVAAVFNTIGVLSGTAVAKTIGTGIVKPEAVDLIAIAAALISLVVWSSAAAYWGLPTSESHALVAGLAGAGLAAAGPTVLLWSGWQKVIIGLVLSTVVGFTVALVFGIVLRWRCAGWRPARAKGTFSRLQILSSMFMAFNHGLNDGQKFMGIFGLALFIGGMSEAVTIPHWVILICATTMGLGTCTGGWRIIQKIGVRMVSLTTWQGFVAETSASFTILAASRYGIPLSTTHTIGTSIMGVGASRGFQGVRWRTVGQLVLAWVLTFPLCFGGSFAVYHVLRGIGRLGGLVR